MMKRKKGFSVVELVVVVGIMAVIIAILAPALLTYTERSRAQKDVSGMDELVNAVELALADADTYDEMIRYSCTNNYITYTDSTGEYGSQIMDGEYWAPDGSGKAVTITFNPEEGKLGQTIYSLDKALVNDMTYGNGSVAQPRTMEGASISGNQCYLKNASLTGSEETAHLYNRLRQTVGDKIKITSSTYKNSSYTIFIKFSQKDGVKTVDVSGSFNGTNLHDGSEASKGSGTSSYDQIDNTPETTISGGKTTVLFTNSDLAGSGSSFGDYKDVVIEDEEEEEIEITGPIAYNHPYKSTIDGRSVEILFYEDGSAVLLDADTFAYLFASNEVEITETSVVLNNGELQLEFGIAPNKTSLILESANVIDGEYTFTLTRIQSGNLIPSVFYMADPHGELGVNLQIMLSAGGDITSFESYSPNVTIPAEEIDWEEHYVFVYGELAAVIYPDGSKILLIEDGNALVFSVVSIEYAKDTPYVADGFFGSPLSLIYRQDGSVDYYSEGRHTMSFPAEDVIVSNAGLSVDLGGGTLSLTHVSAEEYSGLCIVLAGDGIVLPFPAEATTYFDVGTVDIDSAGMVFDNVVDDTLILGDYIGDDGVYYDITEIDIGGGIRTSVSKILVTNTVEVNCQIESNAVVEIVHEDGVERAVYANCPNLKTVHIPVSVTKIYNGTFENCTNLADVHYAGTKAQWEQIAIEEGNDPLLNATIHCSDGDYAE